jgi:hypothetical protein
VKFNHWTFLAVSLAVILLLLLSAVSQAELSPRPDTPEAALSRIRAHIEALLRKPQPGLFARHLRSVLALLGRTLSPFFLALAIMFLPEMKARGHNTVLRGWLSDEGCASRRANGGTYTGTTPDCAKKCVRESKRIVLVDPNHKRLLTILNGDAATERVGDYVEISGDLDEQARTLHIDSLKLLENGRAMCNVPPKRKT